MELEHGYSRATVLRNVAKLCASGAKRESAFFTALCAARVSYFQAHPKGALPAAIAYPGRGRLKEHYAANGAPLAQNPAPRKSAHEIQRGAKLLHDFSGHKAKNATRVRIAETPAVGIAIGKVLGIAYETKRDGVNERYYHKFALKESRPLLVSSSDGKQLLMVGGSYNFTDRGIVDVKRRD